MSKVLKKKIVIETKQSSIPTLPKIKENMGIKHNLDLNES